MNDAVGMNDTIVVEIDIAAPPERVFQAWIDPQQRLAWWGDDATYRGTKLESDCASAASGAPKARQGGQALYRVRRIHARRAAPGARLHVESRLGRAGAPETHVLVELTPTSSGTHVTITHSGFTNVPERDAHNQGWQRVLGWLQSYLQAR